MRLGGVGFADVWDGWIEPCWERCRERRSMDSLSMSSIVVFILSSFGGAGGFVLVGWCISMFWGCGGLAVVVVDCWAMEVSSVGAGSSLFSKVYESVMNRPWVWRRVVACWREIWAEGASSS